MLFLQVWNGHAVQWRTQSDDMPAFEGKLTIREQALAEHSTPLSRNKELVWATIFALCGASIAVATQAYVPSVAEGRWWLNSRAGVSLTLRMLSIAAVVVGAFAPWPPWRRLNWLSPTFFWAGANVGLMAVLFAIGPGSLFPIAGAIGGALTFVPVLVGAVIGIVVRGLMETTVFYGVRLVRGGALIKRT